MMGLDKVTIRKSFARQVMETCLQKAAKELQISIGAVAQYDEGVLDHSFETTRFVFSGIHLYGAGLIAGCQCDVSSKCGGPPRADCTLSINTHGGFKWRFGCCLDEKNRIEIHSVERFGPTDPDWVADEAKKATRHDMFSVFADQRPLSATDLLDPYNERRGNFRVWSSLRTFDNFISNQMKSIPA